jgi:hypothetical protein
MAWPDDLSQVSTNMPEEEFTLIKFAIDHDLVEWVEDGDLYLFGPLGTYPFIFSGQRYMMHEMYELVGLLNREPER